MIDHSEKPMKRLSPLFALLVPAVLTLVSGCQKAPPSQLPSSWVVHSQTDLDTDSDELEMPSAEAEASVDGLVTAPAAALAEIPEPTSGALVGAGPAAWRMEYFVTDLAVSLSGWIGALVTRGTPSVSIAWRRQNTSREKSASPLLAARGESMENLAITSNATPAELESQFEPVVAAAVGSGRVKDARNFRENLLQTALEFQQLGRALERTQKGAWWPARLRMDVMADVSGRVGPNLVIGGDLRLRFEWFRIERKTPQAGTTPPPAPEPLSPLATSLIAFSNAVSGDLAVLAEAPEGPKGFAAHTYRVALAVTHKSSIGIATSKNSLFAHLFFAHDVKKPAVNPPVLVDEKDLLVVDGSTVAKIDHRRFRKGLKKSMKMAKFFTRIAGRAKAGRWKIYEIRTGIDLNLAGKSGLSPVTGLASSELFFYNENF
jgi:hypothetical protein